MGVTPREHAAWLRLTAARVELTAARLRAEAAAVEANTASAALGRAWRESERREFQDHPDLAELDVMLNGFYDHHP